MMPSHRVVYTYGRSIEGLFSGFSTFQNFLKTYGLSKSLQRALIYFFSLLMYSSLHRDKSFTFNGRKIKYPLWFSHTERCIEIPIACDFLERNMAIGMRVLEIGNTLKQRCKEHRVVVDKYEVSPGVINEDILTYHDDLRYDLVLSISTLEHVGFDEAEVVPDKPMLVLEHILTNCLVDGGKALISVPLLYNPAIDELVCRPLDPNIQLTAMVRTSLFNLWEQRPIEEVFKNPSEYSYEGRYFGASAIALLLIDTDKPA